MVVGTRRGRESWQIAQASSFLLATMWKVACEERKSMTLSKNRALSFIHLRLVGQAARLPVANYIRLVLGPLSLPTISYRPEVDGYPGVRLGCLEDVVWVDARPFIEWWLQFGDWVEQNWVLAGREIIFSICLVASWRWACLPARLLVWEEEIWKFIHLHSSLTQTNWPPDSIALFTLSLPFLLPSCPRLKCLWCLGLQTTSKL